MNRIDHPTGVSVLPAPSAPTNTPDRFFFKGNGTSIATTVLEDEWLNMIQEEICNAITGAGLTLDKADRTQLHQAMTTIAGDYLSLSGGTLTGTLILRGGGIATGMHMTPSLPIAPAVGDLWYDPRDLQTYVRYDDGTSVQWVPVINQGAFEDIMSGYLGLGGGTLTGPLTLAGAATQPLQPVTLQQLEAGLAAAHVTVSISFAFSEKPPAGAKLIVPIVFDLDLPANLAGMQTAYDVAPAANAIFLLTRVLAAGGTAAIGSITIPPTGPVLCLTLATSLVAGDALMLTAPDPQDADLETPGISLLAERA